VTTEIQRLECITGNDVSRLAPTHLRKVGQGRAVVQVEVRDEHRREARREVACIEWQQREVGEPVM
jgi:hypothetical protein